MTLDQLRIFVAVAEREHVTEAAQALHLTQSAVSGAIANLETQHGVRLFDRIGRGVTLNDAGRAFLPEARSVLARVDSAKAVLADLNDLRRGRLTIHATPTIANYWLPRHLVAFHAAYPGLETELVIGDTDAVTEAVADGLADLGFVGAVKAGSNLVAEPVGVDQLVLLVRPDHPWASREKLAAADLRSAPWVMREPGSGTRASLEAALLEVGIKPDGIAVNLTLPSNEALLAAAEAGGGATALSEDVAAPSLQAGKLVRAPFTLPAREYHLLAAPNRYRTLAAQAFTASLPLKA